MEAYFQVDGADVGSIDLSQSFALDVGMTFNKVIFEDNIRERIPSIENQSLLAI